MIYGYARVSAPGQDHAGQVAELESAGAQRIYSEKASAAAGRKRPALRQAVTGLQGGDVLLVVSLNRFARSALDALATIKAVTDKGAEFRSLREPWADTTTPAGRLMVTVMSAWSEFDREMILQRTSEGRARSKARGKKLGRPATLNHQQRAFVREQLATGAASIGELAVLLNVGRSTITRANRDAPAAAEGALPTWHAPTCAMLQSGAGAPRRCTCGGVAHGARGLQLDIEEMTGPPAPPGAPRSA